MADTKLTGLTEQTVLALDDWLYSVDKSDTTDDAAGSSRKFAYSTLLQYTIHGLTEITITDATTAPTIGRMHAYKATSADRTVVLPTAASQAGKIIGIRITTDTTKLFTFDGNSTETIDGALTRIMWAGESAYLISDGSNWFKIAGKSIPMHCALSKSTATSCATGTPTYAAMDTVDSESPAGLFNSGQIVLKRPCNAIVYAETVFNTGSGTSTNTQAKIYKNASSTGQVTMVYYFGAYGGPVTCGPMLSLAAGDTLRCYLEQGYGSTQSSFANADKLRFLEEPTW